MKTKYIILFLLTLGFGAESSGQGWFDRFYKGWLTKPHNVDSTYIYQQPLGFTASFTGNLSRQSVMTTSVLKFYLPDYLQNWDVVVKNVMSGELYRSVGVFVGFGRLGAGWSFDVDSREHQNMSTFQFSFRGSKWGLNIDYLAFSQQTENTINLIVRNDTAILQNTTTESVSETASEMKQLTVDGYYVINDRRFAYPPGIAGSMVQLKSAGAWLVAGRFMRGDIDIATDAAYGINRVIANQFSLGCGYSYTWVPYSRPPKSHDSGKGMRTFFLNGSLIPMLTLVNHLAIYPNVDPTMESGPRRFFCWPTPNLMANATVGYSWNRYYLGAMFTYNAFHYNKRNAIVPFEMNLGEDLTDFGTMGVFYEWNLSLKFQVCF